MRIVTALAVAVVTAGLGCSVVASPAAADVVKPIPLSECYTVTVNPPTDIHPGVTVCQP